MFKDILRVCDTESDAASLSFKIAKAVTHLRGPMGWIPEIHESIPGRPSTTSLIKSSRPSGNYLTDEKHFFMEDKELENDGAEEASINSAINALDKKLRTDLLVSTDRLLETLIDMVLPTVADAYIKISRDCPEDPVRFMVEYLREKGIEKETKSRENAHAEFIAALEEANARELQPF